MLTKKWPLSHWNNNNPPYCRLIFILNVGSFIYNSNKKQLSGTDTTYVSLALEILRCLNTRKLNRLPAGSCQELELITYNEGSVPHDESTKEKNASGLSTHPGSCAIIVRHSLKSGLTWRGD